MLYPRFFSTILRRRRETFPVVLLIGPRQSGKTTLAKKLGVEFNATYASFDDINSLASAHADPIAYINALGKPVILDEVQRAPEIFLPIKVDVDNNRIPGRYLLTGSANPLIVPKLGDSLAGRMALCNLWPLSQGEIRGKQEKFLAYIFEDEPWPTQLPSFGKKELIETMFIGGFPTSLAAPTPEARKEWCNNYLSLVLQKDIYDLSKIEGFAHMPALLHGLAARVGSTLNMEELSRITKTPSTTLRRYLQLLESLFLLHRIQPWSSTIDARLTKSPKLHFSDTALLLHVLNLTHEQLLSTPHALGHVVENFVVMECVKQATWHKTNPHLHHFRQERGAEVDLVLEANGKLVGIEVKLSETVGPDDFKGLKHLKEDTGKLFHKGLILYMGNRILPFGQDLLAAPINVLWE